MRNFSAKSPSGWKIQCGLYLTVVTHVIMKELNISEVVFYVDLNRQIFTNQILRLNFLTTIECIIFLTICVHICFSLLLKCCALNKEFLFT